MSYKAISLSDKFPLFLTISKLLVPNLTNIVVEYEKDILYDISFYFDCDGDIPYNEGGLGCSYREFTLGSPTRLQLENIYRTIENNLDCFNGEQNKEDV